ncbi:hypothetical protein HOLleu_13281 [Holothuria leucospilota]|uniref:Uncharacterized protein n=1 Tax=Holothuria leucospilota TaxID=206669 RepID=A0A9Q1HEK7_HOLLE|nr:hypothetical protein HOLleu_13281 [Holothuria leucospilota]
MQMGLRLVSFEYVGESPLPTDMQFFIMWSKLTVSRTSSAFSPASLLPFVYQPRKVVKRDRFKNFFAVLYRLFYSLWFINQEK